jgi:hypothetical protein
MWNKPDPERQILHTLSQMWNLGLQKGNDMNRI